MAIQVVEPGTVSIHFVREALQAASGHGLPVEQVLQRAGIPLGFLSEPLARVSAAQFGVLWRGMARHLQDEFFALDTRPVRPGAFALLCQGLLSCPDLRTVLHHLCRYTEVLLEGLHARLEVAGHTATLCLHDARPRATPFAHATCFMVACGVASWLIAHRMPLLRCEMAGKAPDFEPEYRVMFCEDLRLGASTGRLTFPAELLSMPVVQTRDSLRAFLRHAPDVFLVKYRNMDSLAAQVRARLRAIAPTDWPGLQAMAAALAMAPSSFRRRLDSEGTTFQAIKNGLRRDMAINALRHDGVSVTQLALDLGFTEASAFHRAFVKWTGMRPSDYRHHGVGPVARPQ